VIDALHFKAGMQIVPRWRFVGMKHGAFDDAAPDPRQGVRL
jgi:hypothetical protein